MDPRVVVELREGFTEPIRLTPAQFVALEWDEFSALWKVRLDPGCGFWARGSGAHALAVCGSVRQDCTSTACAGVGCRAAGAGAGSRGLPSTGAALVWGCAPFLASTCPRQGRRRSQRMCLLQSIAAAMMASLPLATRLPDSPDAVRLEVRVRWGCRAQRRWCLGSSAHKSMQDVQGSSPCAAWPASLLHRQQEPGAQLSGQGCRVPQGLLQLPAAPRSSWLCTTARAPEAARGCRSACGARCPPW